MNIEKLNDNAEKVNQTLEGAKMLVTAVVGLICIFAGNKKQ